MPPQRTNRRSRSRSGSITAAPLRPASSHSTSSLRSAPLQDAGAPYPQHRLAPQQSTQHVAINAMDTEQLARMIQMEDSQVVQPSMHSHMTGASQQMPVSAPLQPHMQQALFAQGTMPPYPPQTMDYAFTAQHQHSGIQTQPIYAHERMSHVEIEPKRSRASTGPSNENELRDMLERNLARSLDEIASDVVANERTSSAEKSKQLFAMLWLKQNLVQSKTSVPRIRVHTQYASRCSRYHLQPLNQASFGKLVRVLYPDIQTRRLGVRGESKYHYVDLSLMDDEAEIMAETFRKQSSTNPGPTLANRPPLNLESMSRFEPDSAVIPAEEPSPLPRSPVMGNATSSEADVRVFPKPQEPKFNVPTSLGAKSYRQKMKFSTIPLMRLKDSDEVHLPSIYDFAPAKWDKDIKDALQTTYYSHVISLVDNVRFCKDKSFFRTITAFQGTMTVPVQKLFFHEDVALWVKACDYLMYQKMIKSLLPLTLQVIPPKVIKFLVAMSKLLYDHLVNTFQGIPRHTLDAKLEPATLYCQLLERLTRANQTAHAAGVALIDPGHRTNMWREYVKLVNPKSMMNAFLPDCGYDEDVYRLLTFDVRSLLLPLNTESDLEFKTHYEGAASLQNSQPQPESFELDKFGDLLESLKLRFPTVPSRDLLHFIQGVTSHILRDITMENGESWQCWLLTKCFVDELALWLAHAGGFLEQNPLAMRQQFNSPSNGTTGITNGTSNTSSRSQSQHVSTPDVETAAGRGLTFPAASHGFDAAQARAQGSHSRVETFSLSPVKHSGLLARPELSPSKGLDMDDSGIDLSLTYEMDIKVPVDVQLPLSPSKEIVMSGTDDTDHISTVH